MDLSDLRIFTAVVREGGVTRAAQRLNRVQSNVTTRIRQLEEKLGVSLFIREGKRLTLAPAGQVLMEYADRLLDLADEARSAVHGSAPHGIFRLGAMESTAAVRLPAPLAQYNRRYPQVKLELRTGNPVQLASAVLAGELDAALAAEPVAEARFDSMVAFQEEPVLVTAAPHPPTESSGLLPETVIVFEHGCPHRKILEKLYAERGEVPERIVELGSYHAMLGCVLAGMGAALLPESVLTTFPESRRMHVHRLSGNTANLRTLLFWRRKTMSPNIEALAEVLRENPEIGKSF